MYVCMLCVCVCVCVCRFVNMCIETEPLECMYVSFQSLSTI